MHIAAFSTTNVESRNTSFIKKRFLGDRIHSPVSFFCDKFVNIRILPLTNVVSRSSNYLEDAATEIQVQGLELDYTCLLWDADMRYENGEWHFYRFNGQTKGVEQIANTENKQELMKYMLNAYRVLLTRARAGMVICVPSGNANKTATGFWEDSTRLPEYYDGTYQYLKNIGIEEI